MSFPPSAACAPPTPGLPAGKERGVWIRRGLLLTAASLSWMILEGFVSLWAGLAAGSVALIAFGLDSFIELSSDSVVAWRLSKELRGADGADLERLERRTSRLAGAILLLLAAYVLWDGGRRLLGWGEPAEESPVGIAVTAASLLVMPLFARGKLRVAAALQSRTLRTDAMEAVCCIWLSAATLMGLVLNAALGWSWADPAAAVLIVPLLVREGLAGLRGDPCSRCGAHEG